VAETRIASRETQEFWIALVGVESQFDSTAKSPVGAVGLGQLMPKYQSDFAKACGLPEFVEADLRHDFVNLTLSACHFNSLVKKFESIPLALISYNAGEYSPSIKRAKLGAAPAAEPSAYTTKVWLKHSQATKGQ
jgi:soluble lytic murein transglycosylase-like protein